MLEHACVTCPDSMSFLRRQRPAGVDSLAMELAVRHRDGRGANARAFASTFEWAKVTLSTLVEIHGIQALQDRQLTNMDCCGPSFRKKTNAL